MIARVAAIGVVVVVVMGCSSTSSSPAASGPVIDAANMPTGAAMGSGGVFPLVGTITVHDADSTVTRVHAHATPGPDPPDVTLAQPTASGTVEVTLLFQGTSGATVAYALSVFDAKGRESGVVQKSVTLQ